MNPVPPRQRRHVKVICRLAPTANTQMAGPVHVRLAIEDVSLQDSSSIEVSRTDTIVQPDEALQGPYELDAALTAGRHYAIRAHIDRSGDGTIAPGDLISPRHQAIDDKQDVFHVDVPVTEVI